MIGGFVILALLWGQIGQKVWLYGNIFLSGIGLWLRYG